jgi:hypothetical protein
MKLGPRPKGQPWTPAEDAQLLALLHSKMDTAFLAELAKTVRLGSAMGTPSRPIQSD